LKKTAVEEKSFSGIKDPFETLKKSMEANKKDDYFKFKEEIKKFLEEEIVSRYYFQRGKTESGIKYDLEIKEAIRILLDPAKQKEILTTIEKPKKPFNPNKKF
jgi:carboxyl-terminal processing protease